MHIDEDSLSSFVGKSDLNALAKDFPYQEFMDQVLITPATLNNSMGTMTLSKSFNGLGKSY